MARYSVATALISILSGANFAIQTAAAHEDGDDAEAWFYLPITIPTPLSDMSIVSLTVADENNSTKTRMIITGGCDSELGNEFMEFGSDEWFACNSLTNKVYAFDPIRNNKFQAWTGSFDTLADMPRERARHASAVVDGQVCVFGGRNVEDILIPEVDCYDPVANEWSTPTSLPEEYMSSDLTGYATDDHKVYLIGGYDQDYTALDLVTIVDMSDKSAITFSEGKGLGSARGDIDIAVLNGDYYVSGGFTHENNYEAPKNSVEKYNVETDTWTDVDALNEERGDKQLVALKGKVYAIGGESKVDLTGKVDELPELITGGGSEILDTVEVLDPKEDIHGGMPQWKSLAGMPGQLFRFAAAPWEVEGEDDGYIFVFGGQVGYNSDCKCFETTDKVLVFDVAHAQEEIDEKVKEDESGAGIVSGLFLSSFIAASSLIWLAF